MHSLTHFMCTICDDVYRQVAGPNGLCRASAVRDETCMVISLIP